MVGAEGSVLGTDISQGMVDVARKRIPASHQANVQFSRADAEDLSLDEGTFDVALCSLGLMYVPEPSKALEQMLRVLKRDGRAAVSVWGQRSRCGWAEIFPIVDARVQSEVCPLFFQLGTGDVLMHTCQNTGFTKVNAERLGARLEYDSAEDACGAAFAGGPVALAYSKFSDKVKEEVHAEYLASIAPFQRGVGYSIPGEFVIAYGEKA
jgi:SAM-dependent methyltransferase